MLVAQIIAAKNEISLQTAVAQNRTALNQLAEKSKGFIWHHKFDSGNIPEILMVKGDEYLPVNLSVWQSIDDLYEYVYKTTHGEILHRKADWLKRIQQMQSAIWYVSAGHIPSIEEANERFLLLQSNGATSKAFTFKKRFLESEIEHELPHTL